MHFRYGFVFAAGYPACSYGLSAGLDHVLHELAAPQIACWLHDRSRQIPGLRVARWICRCVAPFQGVTGGRVLQRGRVFVADLPATLRTYVLVDLAGPAC